MEHFIYISLLYAKKYPWRLFLFHHLLLLLLYLYLFKGYINIYSLLFHLNSSVCRVYGSKKYSTEQSTSIASVHHIADYFYHS